MLQRLRRLLTCLGTLDILPQHCSQASGVLVQQNEDLAQEEVTCSSSWVGSECRFRQAIGTATSHCGTPEECLLFLARSNSRSTSKALRGPQINRDN